MMFVVVPAYSTRVSPFVWVLHVWLIVTRWHLASIQRNNLVDISYLRIHSGSRTFVAPRTRSVCRIANTRKTHCPY